MPNVIWCYSMSPSKYVQEFVMNCETHLKEQWNWSRPRRPLCSHSLVCSKNHLFIIGIGPICDKELWFFSIWLIWSYVHFMLGNSTIIYICDAQHLNIIYIILYSSILHFFFEHYFNCNIYDIILIILHHNYGPSRCLFFDIYNTFVVLTTNKPQLFMVIIWLHRIICQQYRQTLRFCHLQTQR